MPTDSRPISAVAARRPVVDYAPEADASIYLHRIARKLVAARQAEAERS